MASHQAFRANVGILVIDDQRNVLAFERSGEPDAWQLPQGGLDVGEEPLDAAYRELVEETGLAREDVEPLGEHPSWLAYELPPRFRRKHWRGQVQRWFLFRIRPDVTIDLADAVDDEFGDHRWMSMSELTRIVWEVRRPIYTELGRHFDL